MKRRTFIFSIIAATAVLLGGASPAMAGRLLSVDVDAGQEQVSRQGTFRLGEQDQIEISYNATVRGSGQVQVHVERKLPNGRWQRIDTPLSTDSSRRGKHQMTLHAGEYRVLVVATNAQVSVGVNN